MDHQVYGRAPLVVAFVEDLMSATKIESVVANLGFRSQIMDSSRLPEAGNDPLDLDRPGEPVHGPLAEVIDLLTIWQPALLVFDLANRIVPWQIWLTVLKSSPATRRFPVICYGPHVDTGMLATARNLVTETEASTI